MSNSTPNMILRLCFPSTSDNSIPVSSTLQHIRTPIHSLNDDVLLEIFTVCRDVDPLSPWTLSQTCRGWRALTLAHSSLWNNIILDRSSAERLGHRCLLRWLHLWLSRSGRGQALDIVIDLHDFNVWVDAAYSRSADDKASARDIHEALRAVCNQAHRWRSFTYLLGGSAKVHWKPYLDQSDWEMIGKFSSMPFLRSITLQQGPEETIDGLTPQYIHYFFEITEAAPSLRSISLVNIESSGIHSNWDVHELSYSITDHRMEGSAHVLSTIRAYPSLHSLQLSGSGWFAATNTEEDRVVLGQLKRLTLEPSALMSKTLFFVGMPLLSELTLDTRDMARQDVFTTTFLDHLALQPHLLLTKLVLYLSFQDVPWTQIVRLSTVEFLHIVKPIKDSFWDRSPSNLSVLYKKIKLPDGTQSWRLPRLHTVVLEATKPYGSISDEFVAGWRQCAVATKQLFMNRWETSMKSGGMLAPLAIDLIGPTWKFEIRHTNQSSNKTGDGRQVEPI